MTQSIARDHLRSFIERVERMNDEADAIKQDISDIYAEAKSSGFDPKVMRKIVAMRKKDANQLSEEEAILELYKNALGMQTSMNFGQDDD